jgi:tetratricopeptide (TPR) repeat protein
LRARCEIARTILLIESSLLFSIFGDSLNRMLRQKHACRFGVGPRFGPLLFRATLTGALLALTVAAQTNLVALLKEARATEKTGDYSGAARIYGQAMALAPKNLEVLKRFGILEQTELKFDASIGHFQQVLALDPKYPEVNFYLGVSYFGKNDFQAAIESFQRELATSKPHPRCRYYLALSLQSSGRMDDAISELSRALADNPKDADALYQLVQLHKSASLQALEKLRAINPDSFQLHALMGETYAEEKHYPEAIAEYRSALQKNPGATGMHFSIGVAYWALHEPDKAEREFKDELTQNPQDPMTNLYLGDIAVQDARYDEAFNYLKVAENSQLDVPQIHALLGTCYHARHDPENAKRELMAAIKADPTAAPPHYLLAQVYQELHDSAASARELSQFEQLSRSAAEKAQNSPGGMAPESK